MPQKILAYQIWLSLPAEIRHNLVVLFDIPKSGHTVVEYRSTGTIVTSDGYTPNDLFAVTLEKMQELLGNDSQDFYGLFEGVVDNLNALVGGTFVPGSFSIPHQDSSPKERVSNIPVIPKWPQFVKDNKAPGRSMADIAKMYKELKDTHEKSTEETGA